MRNICLLLLTLCPAILYAQSLKFNDFTTNYYTQKKRVLAHLDSVHRLIPDNEFYEEGGEYAQFEEWQDFWEPRLTPVGDFGLYYSKLAESYGTRSLRSSNAYATNWSEIGPKDRPTGIIPCNLGQSAGIGPVEFIRFYKNAPFKKMICGSTEGGLFYSDDGGENWSNAGSDTWAAGSSAVSWAEFKVDDPEVIYAACSYQDNNAGGVIGQTGGILKTEKNGTINAGSQWVSIGNYSSLHVSAGCIIKKLLTDPSDPEVLYAATSEGLLKSGNINSVAATWTTILTGNIFDLEMHPGSPNILYASFDGVSSNIVKYSTDGGSTWLPLPAGTGQPNYTAAQLLHVSIEVSDAYPNNVYLYYYGYGNKNLFRFNYISHVYTHINLSTIDDGSSNCCFGSGTSFSVSKSGINEVIFIANNDRYRRYVGNNVVDFTSSSANYAEYHVDIEGFTFNPGNPSELWMASHGGPFKSVNLGNNWQAKMKGVGVAQVEFMADAYTSPGLLLLGLYHDGCILSNSPYISNWDPAWKYAYGCDGSATLINNQDPRYMYASSPGAGWGGSENGGTTVPFPNIYPFNGTPATLNKKAVNVFYGRGNSGYKYEVMRSTNFGKAGPASSIEKISDIAGIAGIPNGCSHVGAIYAFEDNADLLITAFSRDYNNGLPQCNSSTLMSTNSLYYTLHANAPAASVLQDWHLIDLYSQGVRNNSWIRDVELDPQNATTLYVVYGPDWTLPAPRLIYKVTQFTTNPVVTDITYNLPFTGTTLMGLAVEKGSDGGMYLSTDAGIYYTNNKLMTDPANAWVLFGTNYPHLSSAGLEINYQVNKIRSGINGRGIWEAGLYCPTNVNFIESSTYSSNKFLETQGTISATAKVNAPLAVNYRAGDKIILSPGFRANEGSYFRAFIHHCDRPGNSFK